MPEFTVHVPTVHAAKLVDPVNDYIATYDGHPILVRLLAWLGVPDTASLTNKQKGEVFCQLQMYRIVLSPAISDATEAAAAMAQQQTEDEFLPGT